MLRDFKAFVMRGNVLDLAVAVVIGGAFGKVIASLVDDVLMPPLGLLLGRVDFKNLFLDLSGHHYATLVEAEAAGAATIRYGLFLNTIVSFLIVVFAIFVIVRQLRHLMPPPAPPPAEPTRDCPYCLSPIPVKATRCRECTADVARA